MKTIFVLTYKNPFRQHFYTTLSALCTDNPRESLGVSLSTLQKLDFSFDFYENGICKIETAPLKKKEVIY